MYGAVRTIDDTPVLPMYVGELPRLQVYLNPRLASILTELAALVATMP
jgi:hypothetical protein